MDEQTPSKSSELGCCEGISRFIHDCSISLQQLFGYFHWRRRILDFPYPLPYFGWCTRRQYKRLCSCHAANGLRVGVGQGFPISILHFRTVAGRLSIPGKQFLQTGRAIEWKMKDITALIKALIYHYACIFQYSKIVFNINSFQVKYHVLNCIGSCNNVDLPTFFQKWHSFSCHAIKLGLS